MILEYSYYDIARKIVIIVTASPQKVDPIGVWPQFGVPPEDGVFPLEAARPVFFRLFIPLCASVLVGCLDAVRTKVA